MEEQRENIADEECEGNVDGWLDGRGEVTFKEVLQSLRQEYLTALEFNAKDLSPTEIYEALVYKSQLKSIHQLGKGIDSFITEKSTTLEEEVKKIVDDIRMNFPKITSLNT